MGVKNLFKSKKLQVDAFALGSKNYTKFTWNDLSESLENVKEAHRVALVDAKNTGTKTYIAATQDAKGVLNSDVLSWWGDFMKTLSKTIKQIITIEKPIDDKGRALDNINMAAWHRPVKYEGISCEKAINNGEAISKVKK